VQTAPPFITAQPQDASAPIGSQVTFSVTATGTAPLIYQWFFNESRLAGATNSSLIIASTQSTNVGGYAVTITNLYGSSNSATARLTIAPAETPPLITAQPQNVFAAVGSLASFSVTASGTAPLSYQWTFNGTNIADATNSTLTLFNVQSTTAGSYAVTITNLYGTTSSADATLTEFSGPSGYAIFASSANSATKIFTNSAVGGPVTGLTATNAGLYYYALYASATATSVSGRTNAILGNASASYAFYDNNWALVAYGKNAAFRGRLVSASTDDYGQTLIVGFPGGSFVQFVVVGWSANIGATIAEVQSWFNAGSPASDGWIGQSGVSGALQLGDGGILPPVNLFGSSPPFLQGFALGLASSDLSANYPPPNVPPPVLATTRGGGSLKLSWPVSYSSYGVQSASSPTGPWSDSAATPVSDGTNWSVTISTANQQPFYRLIVK